MSGKPGASPRVLHIHGSLAAGNPLAERCARLIEGFGGRLRHTLVSGDGEWGALGGIAKGISVERREDFPKLSGLPAPGRLQKIARAMTDFHLVLTYGRGAIDAALARTMFSEVHVLPPLIHHEDGSDESAKQRSGLRSQWSRRIGLGKTAGLVVPTELMEGVALVDWQQPLGRVKLIRDGVDLEALGDKRRGDAIPRLLKRPGERWIGCQVRFDGSETLTPLLAALSDIDRQWHLVLLGDGPDKDAVAAKVTELGLDDRVHFVSHLPDRATLTRLSDIVALAGGGDPLPQAALEAMVAGKPVTGLDPGEVAASLAADNGQFLVAPGDSKGLHVVLERLAGDDFLRQRTGQANRERAEAERGAKSMIDAYRRLYASAMGRETI